MRKIIWGLLILGLLLVVSCGKADKNKTQNSAEHQHQSEKAEVCAEHGVLESECVRCNPSLIPQFKAKGDWCEEHNLPESQCDICNPALAGKVLISKESVELTGIKTEKVKNQSLEGQIDAPGKVTYNEKRLAQISPRVSGRIEEVFAFLYSKVDEGSPLVSLYSPDYLSAQSEYLQTLQRLKNEKNSGSGEEQATAKALYASAKQKLMLMGATEKELVKIEQSQTIQPYLLIRAPFSGTIVESNVSAGTYIEPQTNLYKLADLSTLWVIADVYEKDIKEIGIGQRAYVTTPLYPEERLRGEVEAVGEVLDEKTRTFKVRVVLANPQGKLKPEMFVQVTLLTNKNSTLALPKTAVLFDGENTIVFVSAGEQAYYRREVKIGKESNGWVQILSGLNPEEEVVIQGNFLLKSEFLKSQMGAGCAE